jgi:beta-glucosidase/6-phospho-beta-glucosidase/beta-galactosidase
MLTVKIQNVIRKRRCQQLLIVILFMQKGKGLSIYDIWMNDPNHVSDGSSGKVACNSYYFYQKDIEALQSLGVIFRV